MRLLIKLEASKNFAYDIKYHHKLQGFLYNLLKNTSYHNLHDRKRYKFFSFSNIFPARDSKKGEVKQLLVSSPDERLIETFKDKLVQLKNNENQIGIGEMFFKIKTVSHSHLK